MSPSSIASLNTRWFIVFRIFFNARFYYSVFAIIFFDFGLTIEQFALLNVIWAITIILAEVPLGAVSDLIGRKKLLVCTAILMVAEMLVWAFAPQSDPTILFWCLAANRILSGLGEAAASGSDEALVYDSIENAGQKDQWSSILARAGRWQSLAFMFALFIGGAIYDIGVVQHAADWMSIDTTITRQTILRWPLYLNIVTAFLTVYAATRFIEPECENRDDNKVSMSNAFTQIWDAGKWILHTPFALVVIIAGAFSDSVIRMFVTMTSEYYRLIEYSPVTFGIIGSAIAGLGFFTAPMAKRMVDKMTPPKVFFAIFAIALSGFIGASYFVPYVGLIFAVLLFVSFTILNFAISYYLNHITNKTNRATVLSFKSMALNLGYGLIGILYAQLVSILRATPDLADNKDLLFKESFNYFPWYFTIGTILVILIARIRCTNITREFKEEENEVAGN